MRFTLIFFLNLLILLSPVKARQIISDLDFSKGDWALIGIPLHNYRNVPIQSELRTFISKDTRFFRELQRSWDFEMTFEDKCDYHYALKFYQNGELVKTLKLNLLCGYVNIDGLAFTFDPNEFTKFKYRAENVDWSRISFGDHANLKKAISILDKSKDVYWYDEVRQFKYQGFFMVSINKLPWSSDRDSLYSKVKDILAYQTRGGDFFLQEYFHEITGDYLNVRYLVNCDEFLVD
ncbi:MAG: hypothetical protein AAF824_25750, partial [Bacteroidota bacterium]